MKKINTYFSLIVATLALVAFAVPCFAQGVDLGQIIPADSPVSLGAAAALAILELVVRLVPTTKDRSLVNFAFKLLNLIVPNRAKDLNGDTGRFTLKSLFHSKN